MLGLVFGAALNLKSTTVVFLAAAIVYSAWRKPVAAWGRIALWTGMGLLPGIIPFLWFNWLRFGHPLALGYGLERDASLGFSVPLWSGLYALLFSSGKSILTAALAAISSAC